MSKTLVFSKGQSSYRRVSFRENHADRMVAWYGMMGKSAYYISRKTKLSLAQVHYRLRKAGISIKAERDTDSVATKMLMHNPQFQRNVERHLVKHVPQDFQQRRKKTA